MKHLKKNTHRHDDATQVRLVLTVVEHPLRVEDVVHRDEVLVLVERAGAHAAQLLHVSANAEQQAEVHAESPDVGSGCCEIFI